MFRFIEGAPDILMLYIIWGKRGFVAYDIQLVWNRPLDNALGQVNMIFVKEKRIFRTSHAFATKEQYGKIFKY